MIRTKGEPGTGDVIQAVRHMRTMTKQIRELASLRDDEVYEAAKQLAVPYELAKYVHDNGRLPVVNFAAGGVATPADAALMMELGAEGVFVGSGIFKSGDPAKRAAAIVQATANWRDADLLASAPRACSSAPASSSPATRPSAPQPLCRPPRTGATPTCSPAFRRTSARRWWASTKTKSRRSWPHAASDTVQLLRTIHGC